MKHSAIFTYCSPDNAFASSMDSKKVRNSPGTEPKVSACGVAGAAMLPRGARAMSKVDTLYWLSSRVVLTKHLSKCICIKGCTLENNTAQSESLPKHDTAN